MAIVVYHVTTAEGLKGIRARGIVPQIGDRAAALGETVSAIYLFPSIEDRDGALSNWLGEWFDDTEVLHSLELHVPSSWVETSTVGYERVSRRPIPFGHVRSIEDL